MIFSRAEFIRKKLETLGYKCKVGRWEAFSKSSNFLNRVKKCFSINDNKELELMFKNLNTKWQDVIAKLSKDNDYFIVIARKTSTEINTTSSVESSSIWANWNKDGKFIGGINNHDCYTESESELHNLLKSFKNEYLDDLLALGNGINNFNGVYVTFRWVYPKSNDPYYHMQKGWSGAPSLGDWYKSDDKGILTGPK